MNVPTDEVAIFPRRLRLARERAGLTLRELEEVTSRTVAYSTLANYEAGRHFPDENVLVRLSKALRVSPDWFFRPFTVELTGVRFRKERAFGAKEQKALISRAADFFELYHEIEELTGATREFRRDELPSSKVKTPEDAEVFSGELRQKWGLGVDPLPSLTDLVEDKGIKIFQTSVAAKLDGMQASTSAGPVIVLNCTSSGVAVSIPRERLTLAHELGHVVFDMPDDVADDEHEKLAWRFAAAFLLPKDSFVDAFGRGRTKISLDELLQLKLTFGASMWAIMRRAWELGLVSRASYDRYSAFAAKSGWKTRGEPGDDQFPARQRNARFVSLVTRAMTEQHITKLRMEEMLEACDADLPSSTAVF